MKRLLAWLILWAVEASVVVYAGGPVKASVIVTGLASAATVVGDRLVMRTP